MAKHTRTKATRSEKSSEKTARREPIDDRALPANLTPDMIARARHASTFPPDTPHSVINQFTEEVRPAIADPRDAKVVETRVEKVERMKGKEGDGPKSVPDVLEVPAGHGTTTSSGTMTEASGKADVKVETRK